PVGYASTEAYSSSNLIWNPYPSGIDWNLANRSLFADNFAYVYDRVSTESGVTEGYKPVDGGTAEAYIAANQGFFVLKNEAGNGTFTFTNAMRAHGGSFTKSNPESEALVLRLDKDNYFDVTTIRVREETEFSRDRSDALKFFSYSSEVPQLYTQADDNISLAINSVPQISEDTEFTLGLRAPASGQYTLSISELSGMFLSGPVFLRDLLSGAEQNLQQNPEYSFQAQEGTDQERFIITFAQATHVPVTGESLVNIYTWEQTLYVNFSEEGANRLLQLYDLGGRLVFSQTLDQGLSHALQMKLEQGMYLVRIQSPKGVTTQRVFVR
ncbi:MAG: T9SS type A sorting domain-containing protein, partial [Bacteroidales bacterium]|nr:T9SS type A sorting domain-containing protein [Bacteroidales bacterium]